MSRLTQTDRLDIALLAAQVDVYDDTQAPCSDDPECPILACHAWYAAMQLHLDHIEQALAENECLQYHPDRGLYHRGLRVCKECNPDD